MSSRIVYCTLVPTLILALGTIGCSSNPHKAESAKTELENSEDVGGGVSLGQNSSGEVVTSRQEKLADQLRDLQHEVYDMEAEIYGNEKLGRKGLYGVLRDCLDRGGEAKRLPSKSILTKGEDKFNGKMVLNEKKKLVNVSEEYYLERIKRFESYKDSYENQKEDFDEKLRVCRLASNKKGAAESSEEAP